MNITQPARPPQRLGPMASEGLNTACKAVFIPLCVLARGSVPFQVVMLGSSYVRDRAPSTRAICRLDSTTFSRTSLRSFGKMWWHPQK